MKKAINILLIALLGIWLVGCTGVSTNTDGTNSSSSNNDNDNEKNEGNEGNDEKGEGNEKGENEGNENKNNSIKSHNQGQACLNCHNGVKQFKLAGGGTVYTLSTAVDGIANIANGYRISLQLANGSKVNFNSGRGTGNSNLRTTTITSTDKFTAQVINSTGGVVKQSNTDSHDGTRLNCNSCHTASGLNNAPGRIVNQ